MMKYIKYFFNGLVEFGKYVCSLIKYFVVGFLTILGVLPRAIVLLFIYIFDKSQRKNIKKRRKSLMSNTMLFISLLIYFMCIYIFFRWTVQTLKINNLNQDIINMSTISEEEDNNVINSLPPSDNDNMISNNNDGDAASSDDQSNNVTYVPSNTSGYGNVNYLNVSFGELLRTNNQVVGWIKMDGTKVNYAIVQGDDNDYYLKHDIYKKENSAGWIFADFRTDLNDLRRNTIIYGHNMNNKTMFGSIPSTLFSSWWQNDSSLHYVKISTPKTNSIWKIFSIYTTEPNVDYLRTVFEDSEYRNFIDSIQRKSFYNFNTDVSVNDYILTLSTCDDTGKKRMVTHAKLIKYEYR